MPCSLYFADSTKPLVVEETLEVVRQMMQEGYRALDLVEYQGSRVVVNASRIAFVRSETNLGPVIPGARD